MTDPTASRWSKLRPLDRTFIIAIAAALALVLVLVIASLTGGVWVAFIALPLAIIVLVLALFAAAAYLAYRIGVIVVREGILSADTERARRAAQQTPAHERYRVAPIAEQTPTDG